jgi:glutamyl-Q tRNA(Asp) synthetase
MSVVTRFAPSPTGLLHLGHAWSALQAFEAARRQGGRFLLRIEDIDTQRCRPEFEAAILEDLAWLGFSWEQPVRRQSDHFDDYRGVLRRLDAMGLLYPCFCSRKQILAEIVAAGSAPHGPLGLLYPGTCRGLASAEREERIAAGEDHALRLDWQAAAAMTGPLTWHEASRGAVPVDPGIAGDVVLARKESPTSYHLAVTHDDHLQGVTLVTRGVDLFEATHVHRLLQAVLGWDAPAYEHHGLLVGPDGKRFAKRDKAMTLAAMRAEGVSAEAVLAMAREMAANGP